MSNWLSNALLVAPDSPRELMQGILTALDDTDRATALAQKACRDVENYTREKRAEGILHFLT